MSRDAWAVCCFEFPLVWCHTLRNTSARLLHADAVPSWTPFGPSRLGPKRKLAQLIVSLTAAFLVSKWAFLFLSNFTFLHFVASFWGKARETKASTHLTHSCAFWNWVQMQRCWACCAMCGHVGPMQGLCWAMHVPAFCTRNHVWIWVFGVVHRRCWTCMYCVRLPKEHYWNVLGILRLSLWRK